MDAKRLQLIELAKIPNLLTAKKRDMILSNVETMPDSAVNHLLDVLNKAKKRLDTIDGDYDKKELPLKKIYLNKIEGFRHNGVIAATRKVEISDAQSNEKDLKNIEKSLNE